MVNFILTNLPEFSFILIGVVATAMAARHRDRQHGDVALMFGSLALVLVIVLVNEQTGYEPRWLMTLAAVLLVTQPYLLLRLVRYLRPLRRFIWRGSQAGMVLLWLLIILVAPPYPAGMQLAAIAYFIVLYGYTIVAFFRGAFRSVGVVRQRLGLAAAASSFLILSLLTNSLAVGPAFSAEARMLLAQYLAIGAALLYYFCFAPPRWLRRAWQMAELREFLEQVNPPPPACRRPAAEIIRCLQQAVERGLIHAVPVVVRPDDERRLITDGTRALPALMLDQAGIVGRAGRDGQPGFALRSLRPAPADLALLEAMEAEVMLAVPITTVQHIWGLLLVFMPFQPLFIDDDLSLLSLLAHHTGLLLENNTLLDDLERLVAAQTAALRASEAQYRRIVETAHEGIWTLGPEGQTTLVNARLAAMLGYTVEEMRGQSLLAFMADEGRAMAEVKIEHPQRVTAEQYEFKFRRKDGGECWGLVALSPLEDDAGQYAGALAMVADITQRKQEEEALRRAEAEVRQLNAILEQRVAERTAELQRANRELEAFSYSVSHDLRAPLRSVDGFSRLLLEEYAGGLHEEAIGYLKRIRRASQQMGELIDGLLDLARVSRLEMQQKPLDLALIVREIIANLREQEPKRVIEVVIEKPLVVEGDLRLLRVALNNLLGNAWKFTRHRNPARIEMGVLEQGGQRVYFVRDNGAGLDMAYAHKLFAPFQRLHSAHEFEGTGIGLATTRRIIERHQGRIWVEGQVGAGATFYFTLHDPREGP